MQLGPVFEVRAYQRTIVVLAGIEADLFLVRKGKPYLRSFGQLASDFDLIVGPLEQPGEGCTEYGIVVDD